jgi:hypothetical protein
MSSVYRIQPIFPQFTDRTKEWQDQLDSQWWRQDQYAEYHQIIGLDRIERNIDRVFRVFDKKLAKRWQWHPFGQCIFGKGTSVLEFLQAFGDDLLTVDGCLRLPSVEADLRNPLDCLSARLELELAAHLKRCGSGIEFRPSVLRNKRSDFVVYSDPLVYFEIKKIQKSDDRLAVEVFVQSLILALSDIVPTSDKPSAKNCQVEIDLHEAVTQRLESRTARGPVTKEIFEKLIPEIRERVAAQEACEFVVPSIGKVRIGTGRHGVRYRLPKNEAQRILRTVKEAHMQLHPDHPGIIVIQSGEVLQPEDVQEIGQGLANLDAQHLAAVAIFPEYFGFPEPFSLFSPFYVLNRKSTYDARRLKAFDDLLNVFSRVPANGLE